MAFDKSDLFARTGLDTDPEKHFEADAPFTIPFFLRKGPAAAGHPAKTGWRDEDFARIAETAQPLRARPGPTEPVELSFFAPPAHPGRESRHDFARTDDEKCAPASPPGGGRRVDIPSDETFFPSGHGTWTDTKTSVAAIYWLLLFAVVAGGGYALDHVRTGASRLDAATEIANRPPFVPVKPETPPQNQSQQAPAMRPENPDAASAEPQGSKEDAFAHRRKLTPRARLAESGPAAPTPHMRPATDEPAHSVALAPGPHPLTLPPSYTDKEALRVDFADNVQKRLTLLGYPSVPRTGVLDTATRRAIRKFQTNSGLPATGEVDSQTLDRLNSATVSR